MGFLANKRILITGMIGARSIAYGIPKTRNSLIPFSTEA